MNLFQTTELAKLEHYIDTDTGEIDMQGFESSQIALKEKQLAVVAWLKNNDANIELLDGAIKDLQARKKLLQTRFDSLKDYLYINMKASGISEITAPNMAFSAKIKKNPHKLIIDDAGKIPSDLYIYPEAPPPHPDNAKIKDMLKAGEVVEGAHLEQGERLEIS
jgi:hypothetical protein